MDMSITSSKATPPACGRIDGLQAADLPHEPRWRKPLRVATRVLLIALAVVACWGAWRWATYPSYPDAAAVPVEESIAFMGTDGFNRMFEWHRRRYALAVAEKMRENSFADILRMILERDPQREQAGRNVRALESRREIGDAFMRVFLDKFFEEPAMKQKAYLTVFAYLQQTEIAKDPERVGLPSADEFKQGMARFISRQPPRVQGQMGQFLIDLRRQREILGLPEPY
jgi:hypothetical protein